MANGTKDGKDCMWELAMQADEEAVVARTMSKVEEARPRDVEVGDVEAMFSPGEETLEVPHTEATSQTLAPVAAREAAKPAKKSRMMIASALAVLAVGATGLIYLQNAPAATSAIVAEKTAIAPAVQTSVAQTIASPATPTLQTTATRTAPAIFRFSDVIRAAGDEVDGRSLSQLVRASATVQPMAGLPNAQWRGKECSSCHGFNAANLCDQGKWYGTHGSAAVDRIGHPFGGGFKRSLQAWASDGCR